MQDSRMRQTQAQNVEYDHSESDTYIQGPTRSPTTIRAGALISFNLGRQSECFSVSEYKSFTYPAIDSGYEGIQPTMSIRSKVGCSITFRVAPGL